MTKFKQFRDPQLDWSGDIAAFYPREFYVFSNFASFQVEWRGKLWPTSEHAYQATRFEVTAPDLYDQVVAAHSAHDAFILAMGNKHRQQADWDEAKQAIMLDICRHKLQQHAYIKEKLLQTMDTEIVEDSPTDSYWGWGADRQGRNVLGKIWMTLRDELKAEGVQ